MSNESTAAYVVGILRVFNKQSNEFERIPSRFLSFGTKTLNARAIQHFPDIEEAESAIVEYYQKELDNQYIDNEDIDTAYAIGNMTSPNQKPFSIKWQCYEVVVNESGVELVVRD